MPKVGNIHFRIDGKEITYHLTYSRKNGFSLLHFPQRLFEVTGLRLGQWFQTEDELVKRYQEVINAYHDATVGLKKVILYSIYLPTGKKMNKVARGNYQGYQSWMNHEFAHKIQSCGSMEAFGFCIDYRVVFRQDKNGTTYFLIKIEDGKEIQSYHFDKPMKDFEMDWTPEREQFFIEMEAGADKMVKAIMGFFGKNQDEMLKLIDGGGLKFLPTNYEKGGQNEQG